MRKVLYRLDVDYLSREYDNRALLISSPIYNKRDGLKAYREALQKTCIDDPAKPVRVHLWRYSFDTAGKNHPVTIRKNF